MKIEDMLEAARREAAKSKSWADFSNFLYSPGTGLLAKAFTTKAARSRFLKSKEYREFRKLLEQVQDRTGLIEGARPTKSVGDFASKAV